MPENATLRVDTSPFTSEQVDLLNRVLPSLAPVQRTWLSGFLQGMDAMVAFAETPQAQSAASALSPTTVLFGSQTGNAERLARELASRLEDAGHAVLLSSMGAYSQKKLAETTRLLIVLSTQGEGDPPDDAESLCAFLASQRAPRLDHLSFAVLALGDRSYEFFCGAGRGLDLRLEELGGTRLCPRVDCDVDFDAAAHDWMGRVISLLSEEEPRQRLVATPVVAATGLTAPSYSRSLPFAATILEQLKITGRGSDTDVRHLELSLEGSRMHFLPGDALGVYPKNDPQLVDELIAEMHWHPEQPVWLGESAGAGSLRQALIEHFEITVLTRPLVERALGLRKDADERTLLAPENAQQLRRFMHGRGLLDLLRDLSLQDLPFDELAPVLRKLPPRLYSIASSSTANPDEPHLTVKVVREELSGGPLPGVCSTYLAERTAPGDAVAAFVNENPRFRPPQDPQAALIMVGAGTGVAPFRAFLEEREAAGASGRTWLFFGARHFRTDFLYQIEWQRWIKEGVLTRMDVAFSRDNTDKVYVQHRMQEQGKDLFAWLEAGAYFYVCGDAKRMAPDVNQALEAIAGCEGHKSSDDARAWVDDLRRQGRYLRDVY